MTRLAQLAEELANIGDEQVGFFHGREVAAAVEFAPVHDVVGQFGEAPDGGRDLVRKHGYAGWRRRMGGRPPRPTSRGLEIEAGGLPGGAPGPVTPHSG